MRKDPCTAHRASQSMVNNRLTWMPDSHSLPHRAVARFARIGYDVASRLQAFGHLASSRVLAAVRRLSLAGRFLVASFVVLVLGMLVMGIWVGGAIERGVLNHSAAVTALYVNSVLSDYLEGLDPQAGVTPADEAT